MRLRDLVLPQVALRPERLEAGLAVIAAAVLPVHVELDTHVRVGVLDVELTAAALQSQYFLPLVVEDVTSVELLSFPVRHVEHLPTVVTRTEGLPQDGLLQGQLVQLAHHHRPLLPPPWLLLSLANKLSLAVFLLVARVFFIVGVVFGSLGRSDLFLVFIVLFILRYLSLDIFVLRIISLSLKFTQRCIFFFQPPAVRVRTEKFVHKLGHFTYFVLQELGEVGDEVRGVLSANEVVLSEVLLVSQSASTQETIDTAHVETAEMFFSVKLCHL